MNIRGSLSNIRVRLRNPRAQRPSDRDLLVPFSTHVQNLLTEANLRGRYWAVDETTITVNPNVSEYLIGVEGFGKPIEVRASYPANPGYPSHDVDFYTLGDINFQVDAPFWAGWFPESFGPYSANQRAAFFRRNGNLYMRTGALPSTGAIYTILYQAGTFNQTTDLDEELLFPEFYSLAELRTAISALPSAEWVDDPRENREIRKELALTLPEDARTTYNLFKSYVATQTAGDQPTYRLLDDFDA